MYQPEESVARHLEAMHVSSPEPCGLDVLEFALLPRQGQELARLLGLPATLKLVENYGGLTLRIPYGETPLGRAMLADIAKRVDHDTARALARKYAATELYIPNCKLALVKVRDAAILRDRAELAEQGLSERQLVQVLALRYRLCDRYIWRILKKTQPAAPPAQRQGSLL